MTAEQNHVYGFFKLFFFNPAKAMDIQTWQNILIFSELNYRPERIFMTKYRLWNKVDDNLKPKSICMLMQDMCRDQIHQIPAEDCSADLFIRFILHNMWRP